MKRPSLYKALCPPGQGTIGYANCMAPYVSHSETIEIVRFQGIGAGEMSKDYTGADFSATELGTQLEGKTRA